MVKNKHIVVAVDKFKGSLTAVEVANAIKKGLVEGKIARESEITMYPMADGGDGSLEVMAASLPKEKVERVKISTSDPKGREIMAEYLIIDKTTAFIEMAKASGLTLLQESDRNPDFTSTYGFGEMIRHAIVESKAQKLILAIGGSATNDGGVGLLTALGFRFKSSANFPSRKISDFLSTIQRIDTSLIENVCPELDKVKISVAVDVDNPLLGENGATMIYGRQKGGDNSTLARLEEGMSNWAKIADKWSEEKWGVEIAKKSQQQGAGAAGGVGFALSAILGAELIPGWKIFSQALSLEEGIKRSSLVITAEGQFDSQSLSGKLPSGVIALCQKYSKPLWVVCGKNAFNDKQRLPLNIEQIISLDNIENNYEKSMKEAASLIVKAIVNR